MRTPSMNQAQSEHSMMPSRPPTVIGMTGMDVSARQARDGVSLHAGRLVEWQLAVSTPVHVGPLDLVSPSVPE